MMAKTATRERLQVLNFNMARDQFNILTVSGQAKNVSQVKINCAQLKARFYDKKGNLLHMLSAVTDDLEPGKIWNFFIIYHREYGEKVESCKITEGICW